MRRQSKLLILLAIPAIFVGWWLFRPELLFVDSRVDETAPSNATSTVLSSGTFVSDAHETSGRAELIRADGNLLLRLSDFRTSNGPDVRVYLVETGQASASEAVRNGRAIELGVLKGNVGNQNYALPEGADPDRFDAVSIWCKRFSVNFGSAALRGPA